MIAQTTLRRRRIAGFTLVEIMVSTALLVAIMVLMLNVVDQTQRLSQRTRGKTTQFQAARNAFDSMARRLSQATLNTYWKAQDLTINAEKADYLFRRQSELQFVSGPTMRFFDAAPRLQSLNEPAEENYPTHAMFFAAPIGFTERVDNNAGNQLEFRSLTSMLSAVGYFIEFGDETDKPQFLANLQPPYPSRLRYRLMEMLVPAEKFNIYARPVDHNRHLDPRILDENKGTDSDPSYYMGLVSTARKPLDTFVRPYWMKEAFRRVSAHPGHRFAYARPMAENIIGLIILPKVPVKDRVDYNTNPPSKNENALELAPEYEYDSWRVLSGTTQKHPETGVNLDNRARDNLLPPIVQVTMIAIDEPAAIKMNLGLTGKPKWFDDKFKKAEYEIDYQEDIQELEKELKDDKQFGTINYRIFTTDVVIRGSKWSRDPDL